MNAPIRLPRVILHVFLLVMAVGWLLPLLWGMFNSFRNYDYTSTHGYFSFGGFTFDNYAQAWQRAEFGEKFLNSLYITVPAVLLTLFLSACVAFVLARFSFKLNLTLLGLFVAANLLPPQALLIPIYRAFNETPLPTWLNSDGELLNSYLGLVLVNTAFQIGFCTLVLSNYMKTLPHEIYESAEVDGASVTRQFFQLTLPLCRPPIAALDHAAGDLDLQRVLLGDGPAHRRRQVPDHQLAQQPARTVLHRLQPALRRARSSSRCRCLVVFFVLQRQFVAGLTLGSTKG